MLTGIELTRTVRKRAILDAVSFEIPAGATATVLGPSGSGKTSLLRTIMGLDRPDRGELHFGDRCLNRDNLHVPPEARQMSLVFQEFTLFPTLDVAANLGFGLKRPGSEKALVDDLLDLLEIGHLKKRRIDKLSGGEQQRVALARALAVRPRVLLMDEPFSNIDNMLRERLYARLKQRLTEYGVTTLIATHDHKEAFFFSDTILVMKAGRLIDQNPPRLIYEQPANAWVAAFFGETNHLPGSALSQLLPGQVLDAQATYLIRPESIELFPAGNGGATAEVASVIYYGAYQDVQLRLVTNGLELRVRSASPEPLHPGDRVAVRLPDSRSPHRLEIPDGPPAG